MKKHCQNFFLKHLKQIQQLPQNKNCAGTVLILDEHTTKLISPLITINLLFDYGIRYLTKVSLKKKPQLNSLSIYFISSDSLKDMFNDFKDEPIYYSINLLLCETIGKQIMQMVGKEEKIIERLASFAELHINCIYQSQNIAFLGDEKMLSSCYQGDLQKAKTLGRQLFTTLICGFGNLLSLDIYYYTSQFCQQIVKQLQISMNQHISSLQKTQEYETLTEVKVIIVDRKFDILSPLIRSFYYYPMVFDLLKIQHSTKPIFKIGQKEITVDLEDEVWKTHKNMHINQALGKINENLVKFKEENKVAQYQKAGIQGKVNDTKTIKNVIKSLPEYNKIVKSYNDHIDLMQEIVKIAKAQNWIQIGELQQSLITNITSKGESEKDKKILGKCLKILQNTQNEETRARMLICLILGIELSDSEKQSLVKQLCKLRNNEHLPQIVKLSGKLPAKLSFQNKQKKESLFLDRHDCKLKTTIQRLLEGKNDKEFRNLKLGDKSNEEKLSKFKKIGEIIPKKNWVLHCVGGIGNNEISNIQILFNKFQENQFNLITDNIYRPISYLKAFQSILKK